MNNKEITIRIKVNDKDTLFSEYNNEVLSSELKSYLENQLVGENVDSKVNIIVNCKKITEIDKKLFETIIKKEYRETLRDLNIQGAENNLKKYILFFLGILFITCSYLIDTNMEQIVAQVLLIFGWVAIWEVASTILFDGSISKLKVKRTKQILNAVVKFEKEK